jgi:hypothetical protein
MFLPLMTRMWAVASMLLIGAGTSSLAQVRINEIFADNKTNIFSDGSISDWVELFNGSGQAVSLAGYSLTDDDTAPRKWVFPAGVEISANGYLVVLLDSTRPPSAAAGPVLNAGFGAGATGDRVELYSPATALVERVRFGPQAANYTIGRVPSGSGNFVLTVPTPGAGNAQQAQLGPQAGLKINEWMASPTSGDDWFELFNPSPLPVQLTGLYFTDNGNEPSPVAPLSFIGGGEDGYLQIFADNSTNDNEVDFGLSGTADSINLFFANGTAINQVQYGQQAQGISQGRLPDGSDAVQTLNTATPGDSNLTLYQGLVVNELLSHTDPPLEDAVEFYNATDTAVNVGGWFLSNSRSDLKRYRVPDGTTVPARGYLVLYENQFNGPTATTPFTFSSEDGDQVYLAEAVGGQLTGRVVEEVFEAAENGVSFGRVETSVPGDHKFVAMGSRTFGMDNPTTLEEFRTGTGKVNSAPRVGPVVISEVMYNPSSPDGITDNTLDEFIELANITTGSVPLFDPLFPTNQWIIQGGVSFRFPRDTTLAANAVALVVSFDPADSTQLAAFKTKYSVPDTARIFGPYLGKLGNGGDQVELYKPDPPQGPGQPDEGFVAYIRVDKVNYLDVAPWPTGADGTGQSLQRKNNTTFGNDPINWEAAVPTAGRVAGGGGGSLEITQFTAPEGNVPATLQFGATVGQQYTVQAQDSLQPTAAWQTVASTNATTTTVVVQDPGSVSRSMRFYRVVSP